MQFDNDNIKFFILKNNNIELSISTSTHMGIVAHADDLEILAYHGILKCYESNEKNFFGVVCTDGGGSPRSNKYKNVSDEEMINIRKVEQEKAAILGNYNGVSFLNYKSSEIKNSHSINMKNDIKKLIKLSNAEIIYTHSLTDGHLTHLAVAIQTINALRELPIKQRPKKFYGCEVWNSLEWLNEKDRIMLNVSDNPKLAKNLLKVYDSQISGGKQYDKATIGRRKANATFNQKHNIDNIDYGIYAMDLMPLVENINLSILDYTTQLIDNFKSDVKKNLLNLNK
jgi:LmbE family N-acetylglucosaminyl deacetylase